MRRQTRTPFHVLFSGTSLLLWLALAGNADLTDLSTLTWRFLVAFVVIAGDGFWWYRRGFRNGRSAGFKAAESFVGNAYEDGARRGIQHFVDFVLKLKKTPTIKPPPGPPS